MKPRKQNELYTEGKMKGLNCSTIPEFVPSWYSFSQPKRHVMGRTYRRQQKAGCRNISLFLMHEKMRSKRENQFVNNLLGFDRSVETCGSWTAHSPQIFFAEICLGLSEIWRQKYWKHFSTLPVRFLKNVYALFSAHVQFWPQLQKEPFETLADGTFQTGESCKVYGGNCKA